MKRMVLAFAFLLVAGIASGQRKPPATVNTETPEGQLLQQIMTEEDGAKKLGLLEQFAEKFPKNESAGWIYAQMQTAYIKGNQLDKAIDIGDKLLALDPSDVEIAHQTLKAAEAKKDAALIIKWSGITSEAAKKAAQLPKPSDEDEVEHWKQRIDFAKQVDTYSEYSVYATALQATDPAQKEQLINALEQRNPKNQYLPVLRNQLFVAHLQAKNMPAALSAAEKALQKDASNEDMLLFAADHYLNQKQYDKTIEYAEKLVSVIEAKPKPEGVSDADWEKRKQTLLGRGHWMAGIAYSAQNKHAQTDKSLRAALPYIKDDTQLLAPALFYLGLSNFRLGDAGKGDTNRILEALRFNQQCAAIKSPFQARAQQNITAIKSKYRVQ